MNMYYPGDGFIGYTLEVPPVTRSKPVKFEDIYTCFELCHGVTVLIYDTYQIDGKRVFKNERELWKLGLKVVYDIVHKYLLHNGYKERDIEYILRSDRNFRMPNESYRKVLLHYHLRSIRRIKNVKVD